MAGVLSDLKSVGQAVYVLYTAVQQVKLNQQQCLLLHNRVAALLPPLQQLSAKELQSISRALTLLLHYVEEITAFINKQNNHGYLRRLIQGQGDQQKFAEYHQTLTQLSQGLHVAVTVDIQNVQQQAIVAQQQDAEYMKDHMQELMLQLIELDGKEMKRHGSMKIFVGERHDAQMYALNKLIKLMQQSTTTPTAPTHTFRSIPFFDLSMEEKIGSGCFGDVYRGVWITMDTIVAIKVLKGDLTDEMKQEFIQEVQLMHDIRGYKHVVTLLGACVDDTKYCIVMEYIANGSLHSLIRRGIAQSWSWSVRCDVAYQMVNSINYLHCLSPPVLHRDIKSLNFLIDQQLSLVVKACDFGLAKVKQECTNQFYVVSGFTGTIAYSAPEQLTFDSEKPRYNEQCDVYSLGIVLWELATGKIAYDGCRPEQIVALVRSEVRLSIPDSVPSYFKDWITQCWSHSPNDRPTCHQLMQQIKPYRSQTAAAVASPSHDVNKTAAVDHFHIATTVKPPQDSSTDQKKTPPAVPPRPPPQFPSSLSSSTYTCILAPLSHAGGLPLLPWQEVPDQSLLSGRVSSHASIPDFGFAVITYDSRIWMFGGCHRTTKIYSVDDPQDLLCFDPNSNHWRVIACHGPQPGLLPTGGVLYHKQMFVWAGFTDPKEALFALDMESYTWKQMQQVPFSLFDVPCPRQSHGACVWKDQMVIAGGYSTFGERWLDDVFSYSFHSHTWSRLPDLPVAIGWHHLFCWNSEIYLFGGFCMQDRFVRCSDGEQQRNLYCLQNGGSQWQLCPCTGQQPTACIGCSLSVVGAHVYVFGGAAEPPTTVPGNKGLTNVATFYDKYCLLANLLPPTAVWLICSASLSMYVCPAPLSFGLNYSSLGVLAYRQPSCSKGARWLIYHKWSTIHLERVTNTRKHRAVLDIYTHTQTYVQ